MLEEIFQGRHARRCFVFHDVMTGRAADSIARQGAVLEVRVLHLSEVNNLAVEVSSAAMVQVELALSHHAMTAETGVNYFARQFFSLRLVFECLQVGQLTIELRIEDRIASSETHRRPAPLTE